MTFQRGSKHPEASETNSSLSTAFDTVYAWLEYSDIIPSYNLKRKRSLPRDTSISRLPPTPLTHINLEKWTESMGGHGNVRGPGHVSLDGSNNLPTDETDSTKPTPFKIPKDANAVKLAMEDHGILQNKAALESYTEFREKMKAILFQDRLSAMKKKEVREFENTLAQVERLNEDTILQTLVPLIVRRTYLAEKDLEGEELASYNAKIANAATDAERMTLRKAFLLSNALWSDDGLLVTMNSEFLRTFLPNQFEELGFEAALATVLAKQNGMKNPRPDYCYGLTPDTFPVPRGVMLSQELRELLRIANGVYHAFLLIEGKADRGELAHAYNQAARGGATLVKASRSLLEKLGDPDVTGVDERTVVFSVAMNSTILEIWLHWADVITDGKTMKTIVNYHSNRLVARALSDPDQLPQSRSMLHNILNWGCNTRKAELLKLHERLYAYSQQETQKQLQEEKARKQDPGNKKRKKGDGTAASSGSRVQASPGSAGR